MIRLYASKETNFNYNGFILNEVVEAVVTEVSNGDFNLEMKLILNDKSKLILEDMIIKIITPRDYQLFRVFSVKKDLKMIYVKARHIFYDLVNDFIVDSRPTTMNCHAALNKLLNDSENPTKFQGVSNISDLKTTYIIRKSVANAIFGNDENSLLNVFGGVLIRDNFTIKINSSGRNLGYKILYGKNLVGITSEIDYSNVVTAIMPTFVKDNIVITLPEKFVISSIESKYNQRFYQEIRYELSEEESSNETTIQNALRKKAQDDFLINQIDKPKINYTINFVELSKTEEYKNYQFIETLDLYDIVSCTVEKLDIDIQASITSYKYDCLKKRYVFIELGNIKPRLLSNTIQKINANLSNVTKTIATLQKNEVINQSHYQNELDKVKQLINSGENGYIVYKRNEDGLIAEQYFMDTNDINTARSVWRWNYQGLAHSSNGVNGDYNVAITSNGKIMADFIQGLQIDSSMINAGVINANHLSINAKEVIRDGLVTNEQVDAKIKSIEQRTTVDGIETIISTFIENNKENITQGVAQQLIHLQETLQNLQGVVIEDKGLLENLKENQATTIDSIEAYKNSATEIIQQAFNIAENNKNTLDQITTTFRQTAEGAEIISGDFTTKFSGNEWAIYDSGKKVMYIDNQRLVITAAVVYDKFFAGNHMFMRSGKTTKIRWVGNML